MTSTTTIPWWLPDVAAEDARRTSRERERLVKEQTGHLNRIRGLLMTLAETNQVYYLHPSFGYYFEAFYQEAHGPSDRKSVV